MLDVYKSTFNLEGQAFRLTPDHRFSFEHQAYSDAKSYLNYAIAEGEGLVAITGAPGTGKTTLISSLIAGLDTSKVTVGIVANVQLAPAGLVNLVAEAFSLEVDHKDNVNALSGLKSFLEQELSKDRRVILIVDEAQGLTGELLEELRLLSNLQHNLKLLLQIFLVGQEGLMEIIRSPGMEQLHQRLIAAAQLKALSHDEMVNYIEHRMKFVGWDNDPSFSDEAYHLIYKFSAGIPRKVNLICHRLFLYAGLKDKHDLLGSDALQVIVELHREGLLTPGARRALGEYVDGIKELATG